MGAGIFNLDIFIEPSISMVRTRRYETGVMYSVLNNIII